MIRPQKLLLSALTTAVALGSIASTSPVLADGFQRDATPTLHTQVLPDPGLLERASSFDMAAPTVEVEEHLLDDFTPVAAGDFAVKGSGRPAVAPSGLTSIGGQADGPAPFGPGDKKGGEGCSIQCITSGKAFARGATSLLQVKTDTPAQIIIEVWNAETYDSHQSEPGVMVFEKHFANLEADTTYQARVYAIDGEGYLSLAEGSFKTLSRNVRIAVPHAFVTEHSFEDSYFMKYIWADGQWLDQFEASALSLTGNKLDWLDNEVVIADAPRMLDFAVQLAELDMSGEYGPVTSSPTGDGPLNMWQENQIWDYATLQDNDLDARPANATSWVEHTIYAFLTMGEDGGALPGGYGSLLEFHVPVVVEVTYE